MESEKDPSLIRICPADEENSLLYLKDTPKIQRPIHNGQPFSPNLSHFNPFHTLLLSNINFNIIFKV